MQVRELSPHRGEMELRQITGLEAGPVGIVREFDKIADLLDREIKVAAASNESHPPHLFVVIAALTADPPRVAQQTDLLVVANGRRDLHQHRGQGRNDLRR
ncbi:hypothetical protein MMAN_32690 [Mycobacterium mantenii]|uniref:Uncharacterized protein n=1 Tax=Mycobacterium mantenii TaxID=560555 RepID=A0ABM7JU78_MYCNT|nr:hypothetical protein MMAN_32690 [Mycobacterium mantenii]